MTIECMEAVLHTTLEMLSKPYGTYVVELHYRYEHEGTYRKSYEVFDYVPVSDYLPRGIAWFNDWNEGEEDCYNGCVYSLDYLIKLAKEKDNK